MEAERLLIESLAAGIRGRQMTGNGCADEAGWQELFGLARQHHVVPLVAEAVYRCANYPEGPTGLVFRREAARLVMGQTMRSAALESLLRDMESAGFHPLVMKGAACRGTYPIPDARPSSDEDLLVPEEEFLPCANWLESRGCSRKQPEKAAETAFELGYTTPEGLYLELHKTPFDPASGAFGACNRFFTDACLRRERMGENGLPVMAPHDHMLFLILHAFKHLIYSGFGIRQVCDILLWAETFGDRVDWPRLREECSSVRAHGFAAAVFRIGVDRLGFDPGKAGLPEEVVGEAEVGQALLADLLAGGVFGKADSDRLHSSTVTLGAVEAQHRGERSSLRTTLFPGRERMEGEYPFVKKHPVLLPVAWGCRLWRYGAGMGKRGGNRPTESLRIGRERQELMRKLDIMD